MTPSPRITFGIIVLNGEPFTRYNLRSLYPFAHQIIVIEGASPHAACIATPDGHSTDGTLDVLKRFKAEEDPENKLQIVTAEDCGHPNGFWPGEKDEQSQAYATRATGDWLWQVDIDEFYRPEDMARVQAMLAADPHIGVVSFHALTFWGSLDVVVDGLYLRHKGGEFYRLFRFGKGYRYATHRPPTVLDPAGRDLRAVNCLDGKTMARRGIRMYHYSLLFPKQVREKCMYYSTAFSGNCSAAQIWAETCYFCLEQPFRVHNIYNHASWLERFDGGHPPEIIRMMEDVRTGVLNADLRPTEDVDALLGSLRYRLGRLRLKAYSAIKGNVILRKPYELVRSLLGGGGREPQAWTGTGPGPDQGPGAASS